MCSILLVRLLRFVDFADKTHVQLLPIILTALEPNACSSASELDRAGFPLHSWPGASHHSEQRQHSPDVMRRVFVSAATFTSWWFPDSRSCLDFELCLSSAPGAGTSIPSTTALHFCANKKIKRMYSQTDTANAPASQIPRTRETSGFQHVTFCFWHKVLIGKNGGVLECGAHCKLSGLAHWSFSCAVTLFHEHRTHVVVTRTH